MNKINLITAPDQIFNDNFKMLLLFPTEQLLTEIQNRILSKVNNLDVYIFDKPNYNKDDVNWLLNVFAFSNCVLIDVDNSAVYCKDLYSFFIAKNKTYWLTNSLNCVYNHISNNKLQDLEILSKIGDHIEKF